MRASVEMMRWPFTDSGIERELVVCADGTAEIFQKQAYSEHVASLPTELRLLAFLFADKSKWTIPVEIEFDLYADLREASIAQDHCQSIRSLDSKSIDSRIIAACRKQHPGRFVLPVDDSQ